MSETLIKNPIINSDFPDPDVIRVDDTYYMISTTMHYFPGAVILRSFDLINWEIYSHVFSELEDIPTEKLMQEKHAYGRGMWAASLRYNSGKFYVFFTAYETGKSFLFVSDSITGPWIKHSYEGIYHDASLLFDNNKLYIISGNKEIRLQEFTEDLTAINDAGINKIIINDDAENIALGAEGAHFYKINNKYYVFLIHWPKTGFGRRTELVYISDKIDEGYKGYTIFDDDLGYFNQGVAQGGIVDTPDGDYFAVLFQDRGAIGRSPYLIPMHFENDIPVLTNPSDYKGQIKSTRPEYVYKKLFTSAIFENEDDVDDKTIRQEWEFNHIPDPSLWEREDNDLVILSNKISANITQAKNTLTQRMVGPKCSMSVGIDASNLKEGDSAGLSAFIGNYCWIGVSREIGRFFMTVVKRDPKAVGKDAIHYLPGIEEIKIPLDGNICEVKAVADFTDMKDTIELYYRKNKRWIKVYEQKINFALDFFTGCRFGLFLMSTKRIGGKVTFFDVAYNYLAD